MPSVVFSFLLFADAGGFYQHEPVNLYPLVDKLIAINQVFTIVCRLLINLLCKSMTSYFEGMRHEAAEGIVGAV